MGAIRIFIFKSEANPDLRAFGDLALNCRVSSPWRAVGAIAPDQELPYNFSRRD